MKKIRILLSGKNNTGNYVDAVIGVGGSATAEYLPAVDTGFDGLILCGGADIDPKYYNEELGGSVNIDLDRDEAEFALLDAYVKAGKPVLGICRGHQLINAYFGGSLYQHIPEAALHTSRADFICTHNVTAEEDSVLGRLYGTSFPVNSSHHQNVKVLGQGLRATAYWNGRYVEAFEHTSLPVLGVQWHPERMCFRYKNPDTVDGSEIFRYFLRLCEERI